MYFILTFSLFNDFISSLGYGCRKIGRVVNNETLRMWKEAVAA
jgi:hypothetical protein